MFAKTNDDAYGGTQAYNPDQQNDATGDDNPFLIKKQPTKCRDPVFAVLLYANVAAMIGISIKYGGALIATATADADADAAAAGGETTAATDYTGIINIALATAGFATVLSAATMQLLMCIPGILIKVALLFNAVLVLIIAAVSLYYGNMIGGIIGLVFFAFFLCYAKLVWKRIPFATANLKTACSAIRSNCGVTIIAYVFTALAFAWTVLWSLALAGTQEYLLACEEVDVDGVTQTVCNPNYGYLFLFFLSFFFTHQVIQNCVHVTVAGVVASWWFTPKSSGCCSSAVFGSFFRTMTTSFGSVCFGSLLVALIQAIRQLAETARQNDELGNMLACCIDCVLSCLQSIIEYFNKWAFVYVGIYGYGYCEAGKSVIQLFKDRGWEAVIADDLVGMVLFMMSLIVGLVTGGVAILLEQNTGWFEDYVADADPRIFVFM